MKSIDTMGVYACSSCAWVTDNKPWSIPAKDWLRAIAETHIKLIEKGIMVIRGMK